MNKATTIALTCLALAACDAPSDQMTINPAGMERVDQLGVDAIAPSVSPQVALQAFADFCGRFPANPGGTRRAVEAEGYVLFVSGTGDELDMFASPDGRPLVATGRRDGAEVCMVMMAEGRDLGTAIENYVTQKHGGTALPIGELQTPDGTAENVWATLDNPPVIYFSLVQNQPGIGRIEAFAQVTE